MITLCLLLLATTAPAAPADVPSYSCIATTRPVKIDGKLDDAAWAGASWTEDFANITGADHPAPPLRTRAKLLWDAEHLYVAAELAETAVAATMRTHDSPLFREDAFEVFLDPDADGANYVELEINALNTTFDLLMSKPYRQRGRADARWEIEGMRTAVHVDGTLNDASDKDRAWTAEIAIPWAALRELGTESIPPKAGQRWRMNLARVFTPLDGEPRTPVAWSPIGRVDLHVPAKWGWLNFAGAEAKPSRPN
jgi:hypothetical protein